MASKKKAKGTNVIFPPFKLDKSLKKRVKNYCTENDSTLQDFAIGAFMDKLQGTGF